MKYETPEVTTLTPAINAIQSQKIAPVNLERPVHDEVNSAYEDCE